MSDDYDDDDEWIKLTQAKDLGSRYYRLDIAWPTSNKSLQKVFHAFQQIEIRWPDGLEKVLEVTMKSTIEVVNDHGETYNVLSHLPVIVADHCGVEILVEFQQVEIRRRCLKGPGLREPDPDDGEEMDLDDGEEMMETG